MQTLVIDTSYGSTVGVVGHEPIVETDSRTHVEKLQVNIAQAVEQAGLQASDITTSSSASDRRHSPACAPASSRPRHWPSPQARNWSDRTCSRRNAWHILKLRTIAAI